MTKIWKNLICTILVLLSIYLYIDFLRGSYFSVEEISLESELNLVDFELRDHLAKLKGRNIWELDYKKVEEELKKDVRIKEISIKRKLPNTLLVNIEEEKIFAKVKYDEKLYFINEFGEVFAYNEELSFEDLLVIDVKDLVELEDMVVVANELYKTKGEKLVSELFLDESKNVIVLLSGGTKVISDNLVDSEKYNTAFALYRGLVEKGRAIEYIDIRFSDFIVK